ncbi:hypothetical protein DFR52_102744 [Hoeflea marina]|uniref:Glycosyl transferase family 29 (Putative sialyltransferase) n=1 Tax=Hoeflea marina TaxID=274592 RepID=A0A317PMT9_9HYPH|nr:hypothetical protein [Hoeflea marina]PWW02077.1 hypothetical protein DFR52_102744 [Hoeflea marina]
MKTVAIVGNGPLEEADKRFVGAADIVTRFNLVPREHLALSDRTDEHFLSCSSKQVGDYLAAGSYESDPCFRNAGRIVLPYHPGIIAACMPQPSWLSRLKGRRADWTSVCERAAARFGKQLVILTEEDYRSACRALGIGGEGRDFYPSSGYLAVMRALKIYQPSMHRIHLLGFGFQGWKRHPWPAEEAAIRALHAQDRLSLHAVA